MDNRLKQQILNKFAQSEHFKINFVCSGNIIRSPYAHLLFTHILKGTELEKRITVESSAVKYRNYQISNESSQMLRSEGVSKEEIDQFRPRHFMDHPQIYDDVDLILVMEKNHITQLPDRFREKAFLLLDFTQDKNINVPDPYFNPPYERAYRMISEALVILKDLFLQSLQ